MEAYTLFGVGGLHSSWLWWKTPVTPTDTPQAASVIGTYWGPLIPQRLQTWRRAIYSSAVQLSNNSANQLILHSWFPNNRHTHTHTHTEARKHCHNSKSMHAHRHMHTVLHMLKPLSCCLLSHYSIACYFLKQEKAIYPQRSAERFATRRSLGIWEVTLKFEECGEVWNLRNREGREKKIIFWNSEASFPESLQPRSVRDVRGEGVL